MKYGRVAKKLKLKDALTQGLEELANNGDSWYILPFGDKDMGHLYIKVNKNE